jgi:hypothetical protein
MGERRIVTVDDLKKGYEKSSGADESFRQAADLRKQAARGIRLQDLADRGSRGELNESELTEFAGMMGLSPGQFMQGDASSDEEEEAPARTRSPSPARAVREEDLDPALRGRLQMAHEQAIAQRRKEIEAETFGTVDKDQILSKLVGGDADRKETVQSLVYNEVQRRVLVLGEPYGPELLARAVQTVRPVVERLSKSRGTSEQAGFYPGFGPAPSAPSALHATKPPERVPVSDPAYEDNLTRRALFGEFSGG